MISTTLDIASPKHDTATHHFPVHLGIHSILLLFPDTTNRKSSLLQHLPHYRLSVLR